MVAKKTPKSRTRGRDGKLGVVAGASFESLGWYGHAHFHGGTGCGSALLCFAIPPFRVSPPTS